MKKSATKGQSTKISKDLLTVEKLLDKDDLKELANRIVSEDIDNVILIFRDKKVNSIGWATVIRDWALVLGSVNMVHELMMEEWSNQRFKDGEDE